MMKYREINEIIFHGKSNCGSFNTHLHMNTYIRIYLIR